MISCYNWQGLSQFFFNLDLIHRLKECLNFLGFGVFQHIQTVMGTVADVYVMSFMIMR